MPGARVADIGGAWVAVAGILAALLARATTGRAQTVDVSLVEATTSFVALQLGAVVQGGAAPVRGQEPLDGGLPSYGLYRTADGRWLAVAALEPHFFQALCQRLGLPDLTAEAYGGGAPAEAVRRRLADIFASASLPEWEARLAGLDACVEPVRDVAEVPGDAPSSPGAPFPPPASRPRRCASGLLPHVPPPALGEHGREVLGEAGLLAGGGSPRPRSPLIPRRACASLPVWH
jgi:crotonobetainyl-CoA:carnitine CoA-transferase CaiB-like acyl-CoA transferase